MKRYSLRTVIALLVVLCAAAIATATPKLTVNNESGGRIGYFGESDVDRAIYFSRVIFEVDDIGEATAGTLTLTSTGSATGVYLDDDGNVKGVQDFVAGTPVELHLKRMHDPVGGYYMQACDADGNYLYIGIDPGYNPGDQTAFSGASFKIKVGSEPEVSGTIPTMRPTRDFTDDIGMPYVTLRYSEKRDMIEGVDWKFVKRSDPKTTLTYHSGDPIAYMHRVRAYRFEGARETKVIDKTFADGEKMEGSAIFDQPVALVDLASIRVLFRLSDALDTGKVSASHSFRYYTQSGFFADNYVDIRQSFGKTKGEDGTYTSIGVPTADSMLFEIGGQGASKSGTLEFTPLKDVTASCSRNGVVEATEVYKAGVKKTLDLIRLPGSWTAWMQPYDAAGRSISFRAVDGSDANIYALCGTRYVAKVGDHTIDAAVVDQKPLSKLLSDGDATPNIKCTLNSDGKVTKVDWWFSKGSDRSVAAKFVEGDYINYVQPLRITGGTGKNKVRFYAPGSDRRFGSGEEMSGTWELTEDQYIYPDEIQDIRVVGRHDDLGYLTYFVPVAEVIGDGDVKDAGSDGATVESAVPNQPTPSEIASALEDLVDALRKLMDIIKDSPTIKAFDVINTIKMNVTHTKDDGTANVAIDNFEREPKQGHEFVVLTKRKAAATDSGKWDIHRGVRYDRAAHKLSFSIPNVGLYFSESDVVLAEAQIEGSSGGSSSGSCAAGAAAFVALAALAAIKHRK